METAIGDYLLLHLYPPLYSLEKLIEWKPTKANLFSLVSPSSLYSLEKLIEWKRIREILPGVRPVHPLLAREIN